MSKYDELLAAQRAEAKEMLNNLLTAKNDVKKDYEDECHPVVKEWKKDHPGITWRHACDICKNSYVKNNCLVCDKNFRYIILWRYLDFEMGQKTWFGCDFFDCDEEKEINLVKMLNKAHDILNN